MATRTLNVLLTGDSTSLAQSFLGGSKKAMAAKAGLAGIVVGAGLAGKALYDIGSEFDSAYDKIRTGTGKTGKALEHLKNDFRAVVTTVPADFEDVAAAITDVTRRLGVTGKPLRQLSRQFLEFSRISGEDMKGTIQGVARAFEDWDVPIKKQSKQFDEFFRATQMSGSTMADLTQLLVKFGSPLRTMGFEVQEATAMFASFEKAGVNIQTMMPGLKMALKHFLEEGVKPGNVGDEIKKMFKGIEDGSVPATKALDVFGARAGADMIEAVKQGRFHLDSFMKKMRESDDTIMKAGRSTRDTSENFKILGNKLKVLVEPAATAVFEAMGRVSGALARFNFRKAFKEIGPTVKEIGFIIKRLVQIFSDVFGPAIRNIVQGFISFFKGMARVIKGIVQVIGGILKGDFRQIWAGVKNIFGGAIQATLGLLKAATAPIRRIAGLVGEGMLKGFSFAWDRIKALFKTGVNAVIGFVNLIIDAINIIPGVDIGHVGEIGGGGGGGKKKGPQGPVGPKGAQRRARGGSITRPMILVGEEAPTHPEWVIATNPAYRKKNVGHWMQAGHDLGVPGFALGGIGSAVGSAVGKAVSSLPGVPILAPAISASDVISKLPSVSGLPSAFKGLGGWVLEKISSWIKDKVGSIGGGGAGGGGDRTLGGLIAEANRMDKLHQPYVWGGGHGATPSFSGPWDCSGAISQLVSGAGWPMGTAVSGTMASWFHPGRGPFSILANAEHVYSVIGGRAFGTSSENPGGGAGWIDSYTYRPGFSVRHPILASPETPSGQGRRGGGGAGQKLAKGFAKGGLLGGLLGFKEGGKNNWRNMVGGSWDNDELATLAHVTGISNPGLMGQIAMGESSGDPNAVGHDSGGTEGLGLWQITTGYNDELIAKLGGRSAMFNPLINAKAAKYLLDHGGVMGPPTWYAPPTGPRGSVDARLAAALRGRSVSGGGGGLSKAGRKIAAAKAKAEKRKGKTSKGGGTFGPFGVGAGGAGKGREESVPGLGAAPKLGGAALGLGERFQKMLRVPGLSWAGKMAVGDFALESSEFTEDKADDIAAQKYRIEQMKRRKLNVQKQIAKVNKELKGRMSKKKQTALLAKRGTLEGTLREMMGGIAGARRGISEAGEAGEAGEVEETEPQRLAREAQEANTRAVEEAAQATAEHTAAVKELESEMKANRELSERESTLSGTVMMKALADMLANYLGPVTFEHARVAGPGTVGAL